MRVVLKNGAPTVSKMVKRAKEIEDGAFAISFKKCSDFIIRLYKEYLDEKPSKRGYKALYEGKIPKRDRLLRGDKPTKKQREELITLLSLHLRDDVNFKDFVRLVGEEGASTDEEMLAVVKKHWGGVDGCFIVFHNHLIRCHADE